MGLKGALISPAEPALIKTLGRVSSVPEKWGCDILLPSIRLGIQRKEHSDFVASLTGDRLAKEVMQMRRLLYRVVVVEGRPAWTADGEWLNGFQKFTLKQYWGAMLSLQSKGIMVLHSRDMRETVKVIEECVSWVGKGSHDSLSTRPKYLMSKWGTRDDEEWQAWVLQGLEGVGPKMARAIVKQFGGAPIGWTVTEEELRKVPGVGKETARKLIRALRGEKKSDVTSEALAVIQHEADFFAVQAKNQAWRNHAQVILDAVKVLQGGESRNGTRGK